jgi:predicted 3-demethylubiquinone-9 3-methyltransferase (glyoxalase superfamily)
MQKITPFLWFDDKAEEAAEFYVSVFKNSKITSKMHYGDEVPGPKGKVMTIAFELEGQAFTALNGGPVEGFTFSPATSFVISCANQTEVDYYWEKLSADPAAEQCGWLRDKFGITWQVVPKVLGELLGGPDPEKAKRATKAMLQMKKLDIAALQKAYDGK